MPGTWLQHPKFGDQFRVSSVVSLKAHTADSVYQFLASGLFKGVGPKVAQRIVDHLGADAIATLDSGDFDKLGAVKGVSKRVVEDIKNHWGSAKALRDLVMFLQVQACVCLRARDYLCCCCERRWSQTCSPLTDR